MKRRIQIDAYLVGQVAGDLVVKFFCVRKGIDPRELSKTVNADLQGFFLGLIDSISLHCKGKEMAK